MRTVRYFAVLPVMLILVLFPSMVAAREGLYIPSHVETPFNQSRVLRSLVRITENIYWDTIVLDDDSEVATLKRSFTYYRGTGRKTYLPQGAILWHVVLTKNDLLKLLEDPNSAYDEGIADIARSFRDVQKFPAERITPITGWANATFVSPNGLLLTNYHVVREQIEALQRESGCSGEVPAPYLRAEAANVRGGHIIGWRRLKDVDLVANLSSADWQDGLDGALLRVRDRVQHSFLPIRHAGASIGEPVWMYGFPFSTHRAQSSLARYHYTDADETLRVSVGAVTARKGSDFISDTDGINGDSGGAVVDQAGYLLGYDWDTEGQTHEDRVTSFAGGNIAVSASAAMSSLLRLPRCQAR